MTKAEYSLKLKQLLFNMVGETVKNESLGIGRILGFVENAVLVKFQECENLKRMSIDHFFEFNHPLKEKTKDLYDELRCEYELSQESLEESMVKLSKETKPELKELKRHNVTFDDVIGLDKIKEQIFKMVVYPFKYSEIYDTFKRSSGGGLLLYGAPGTGKTLIAKAIANEIDAKFFSIKCSDIVSKWFGESENKIKDLFKEARKEPKSIIFFDEFDSLGSNREDNSLRPNSRIVSELLTQIDGFETYDSTVLVIAATNRPWDIDSALLRSGRFNKKIYVKLPDQEARVELLAHELKEVPTKDIDYLKISELTDGYSSADMVELANEAKDLAIIRTIGSKDVSPIETKDLEAALMNVKSTVIKRELMKLEAF